MILNKKTLKSIEKIRILKSNEYNKLLVLNEKTNNLKYEYNKTINFNKKVNYFKNNDKLKYLTDIEKKILNNLIKNDRFIIIKLNNDIVKLLDLRTSLYVNTLTYYREAKSKNLKYNIKVYVYYINFFNYDNNYCYVLLNKNELNSFKKYYTLSNCKVKDLYVYDYEKQFKKDKDKNKNKNYDKLTIDIIYKIIDNINNKIINYNEKNNNNDLFVYINLFNKFNDLLIKELNNNSYYDNIYNNNSLHNEKSNYNDYYNFNDINYNKSFKIDYNKEGYNNYYCNNNFIDINKKIRMLNKKRLNKNITFYENKKLYNLGRYNIINFYNNLYKKGLLTENDKIKCLKQLEKNKKELKEYYKLNLELLKLLNFKI